MLIEDYRSIKFGDQLEIALRSNVDFPNNSKYSHEICDCKNANKFHLFLSLGWVHSRENRNEGQVGLLIPKPHFIRTFTWEDTLINLGKYELAEKFAGRWVLPEHIRFIKRQAKPEEPILRCIECKEFYEYAEPNFESTKLVCFRCRDRLGWKYTKINGIISLR